MIPAPVECNFCHIPSYNFGDDEQGQYIYCDTCDKIVYFFHFQCPTCKEKSVMYEMIKEGIIYQCMNCKELFLMKEVEETPSGATARWLRISGKDAEKISEFLKNKTKFYLRKQGKIYQVIVQDSVQSS